MFCHLVQYSEHSLVAPNKHTNNIKNIYKISIVRIKIYETSGKDQLAKVVTKEIGQKKVGLK